MSETSEPPQLSLMRATDESLRAGAGSAKPPRAPTQRTASAIYQGQTSVAAIGVVTKKPDQFGKAMLFPAMVETYAILALLISILAVFSL